MTGRSTRGAPSGGEPPRWLAAITLTAVVACGATPRRDVVTIPPPAAETVAVQPPRRVEPAGPCSWDLVDGEVRLDGEPQHADSAMRRDDEPHAPATAQEIDLDGRPPADLVVDLGMCGSSVACQTAVLQACDGGGYRAVWGPEYANAIEVGSRPRRSTLADLIVRSRFRVPACDMPLRTHLRWDGHGWKDLGTCAEDGPRSGSEADQEESGCNDFVPCDEGNR